MDQQSVLDIIGGTVLNIPPFLNMYWPTISVREIPLTNIGVFDITPLSILWLCLFHTTGSTKHVGGH